MRHTFVITLLLFVLGSAAATVAAQNAGAIAGAVVARVDGRPVPDAAITVNGAGASAIANASGRFRIDGLPAGTVTVVVRAPGFLEQRAGVTVRGGDTTSLRVELEATPNFMEHVQVTATKSPLSIGDVAAQTDVVGKAAIESRGDQTLSQAIAHVPGAIVSTQLGIFDSVMLRGLPRGDPEFTNTLLLVDGVPQTLSNNGARVVALPINDASSIEIVRGPNSALYGRTAIGGSVNVRTADPTPSREFAVDFTGGELGMLKGLARVSGPVRQWGGYYVSFGGERNSGYFKTKTQTDYLDYNSAVFAKLSFARGKSSGSVSVNGVSSQNSTPTNEPVIDGRLLHEIDPRFDRFTSFNLPGRNYQQDESRLTLNYTRTLGERARLVEVFGYRSVLHDFVEDGDFIGSPFDLSRQLVTQYPFSQTLDENITYEELRLEITPTFGSATNLLTIGGSYEYNTGSIDSDFIFTDEDTGGWPISYLNPAFPPRNLWQHDTGSRRYHLGITGIFGQYLIEPTPRVVVTAGGRYDRLDLDNSRNGGAKIEDTFDAFSPKASATFKVLGAGGGSPATLNLYAAYSHAFLPPRRPSSLVPADVPLNLKPEDIDNYEGGVKASLFGNRLALEATYFYMLEDGVVLSTRQGPFFLPTNAGEQKYKGVETGATVAISPQASVYGNASFYRNHFGTFVIQSADGDEVLTGNRLPISPDYVVNWGATVRPAPALEATFDVKHVSAVQTNRENSFELEPYSLVDAAVTWRASGIRLTLSAHNLFDTKYYWNGDGETADPGRPRQVLFSISKIFR